MKLNFVIEQFRKQASISSRVHKPMSVSLTKVKADFSHSGAFPLIIIFLAITTTRTDLFQTKSFHEDF